MKIGFWGLLQIAFIILKLLDLISWPWVYVLLPAWGGLVIFILFLLTVLGIGAWAETLKK